MKLRADEVSFFSFLSGLLFSFILGLTLTSPDTAVYIFLLKGSFNLSVEKFTAFGLGARLLSRDASIRAISFVRGDGYVIPIGVDLIVAEGEGEGILVGLLSIPEKRKADTLNPSAFMEFLRLDLPAF